ncbi:50S ribosomal protein L36 [Lacticaseibacillus rhamnosus]
MEVCNSLGALKSKDGSYVVRRRGSVFVMDKRNPKVRARRV